MDCTGPGPETGHKRRAETEVDLGCTKSESGPEPSGVSLRSDASKDFVVDFKEGQTGSFPQLRASSAPYGPGAESLRSDRSRSLDILFKDSYQRDKDLSVPIGQEPQTELDVIFQDISRHFQLQLQEYHRLLTSDYPECSESEEEQGSREVLNIILDHLKKTGHEQLAQRLLSRTKVGCSDNLKSDLQQRFSRVFEGVATAGNSAPLTQIYTELYITEGGASEVNQEHEVRHLERVSRRMITDETIKCKNIFKARPHSPEPIRVVLTNGVAGVGKTMLTQKFSLDWAEGRINQDVQLLFPFTFRELNVLRDTPFSLVELLHHFFSPSKGLFSFQQLQVLFILDGLDECRPPLDFSQTRVLSDPTESVSVDVLLVNLIRGKLLPSARLWITTRPAAANQIPAECISMVTEVRGFTDLQKEQYFRNSFRDEADRIISHIKSIRSLHIMSHIPVFCWILSTVIQKLLEPTEKPELPRTLTQMYIHFLVLQAKVKNIKYHQGSGADLHWTPETKEMVLSLGKLAFEQLQKGNLIFYECDLSESLLDAAAASVNSGVFTQVFKEEPGLYQDKVYCFIHLSVQEFLAALYVHQTFFSSGQNLLEPSHSSEEYSDSEDDHSISSEAAFYRSAVDQALQSPNGHLNLFLRFLLGLSLKPKQSLLEGLLTQTAGDRTNEATVKYIKLKLNKEGVSADRGFNLLHCLNELDDLSLVKEIQENMRTGRLSFKELSSVNWTALCFLLLSSDSDLEEFDLRKYNPSETAFLGLLPVIKASTKALLSGCGLSPHCCGPLASVLSSSSLTHLDLSHNDLQDLGVELLCSGLKSASCRLQTLRLSGCLVSEKGGAALASTLSSTHSHLSKLDLSYNHPGSSAELLTSLLDEPHCPLQSVRLDPAGECWMVPGLRKYSREFSLDPNTAHKRLLLSEDNQTVTWMKEEQQCPDHKDRFTYYCQVLGSLGMTGCRYWEVDWSGKGGVSIAVTYKGISRRGKRKECRFGDNNLSWSLRICDGDYFVWHNNIYSQASSSHSCGEGVSSDRESMSSGRVGVFLDYEAGALSFYQVSSDGELSHLHTFSSSFTEPLFPGFRVWTEGSSVTLVTEPHSDL